MKNSYLTNLTEASEKKRIYYKGPASEIQKVIEARGEHQITQYSASKALNTS